MERTGRGEDGAYLDGQLGEVLYCLAVEELLRGENGEAMEEK